MVDVGSSGEGVANRAAKASCRAAKGLDLGGVVVRLVLEHDEPLFLFPVDIDRNDDGGRVDFFGDFDIVEFARFAELLMATRAMSIKVMGRAVSGP